MRDGVTEYPFRKSARGGGRRDMSHLNLRKDEKQTEFCGLTIFLLLDGEERLSQGWEPLEAAGCSAEGWQRLSGGPITPPVSPWMQKSPVLVTPGGSAAPQLQGSRAFPGVWLVERQIQPMSGAKMQGSMHNQRLSLVGLSPKLVQDKGCVQDFGCSAQIQLFLLGRNHLKSWAGLLVQREKCVHDQASKSHELECTCSWNEVHQM